MLRKLPIVILVVLIALVFPLKISAQEAENDPLCGDIPCGVAAVADCTEGNKTNLQCTTRAANSATIIQSIDLLNSRALNPNQSYDLYRRSAMGAIENGIALLYQYPAADTRFYIADVANHIGIVSSAYAQDMSRGIGFSGLTPILPIWKGFRNIAYAFLTLLMIIIGFMIMFRKKIDPRTVMTIQAALPRVVLTLILVTFSYAIAGLLIDLMYAVIGIAYVGFGFAGTTAAGVVDTVAQNSFPNIFQIVLNLAWQSKEDIYGIFGGIFKSSSLMHNLGDTGAYGIIGLGAAIGALVMGPSGFFIGGLVGAAIGAIPLLILLVTALFAMLRIFFMLVSAYMQVLLSIIFAPLQIMMGAIPGNDSFNSWLRNMIANLSVFAVTVILAILGLILGNSALDPSNNGYLWTPPGIGAGSARSLAGLIGLGVALIIPNMVAMIKESLKAKPSMPVGPSIFLGSIGTTFGAFQQAMYFKSMIKGGKHGPPGGH